MGLLRIDTLTNGDLSTFFSTLAAIVALAVRMTLRNDLDFCGLKPIRTGYSVKRLCNCLPSIFPSISEVSRTIACEDLTCPDNNIACSRKNPILHQGCTRQVRSDRPSLAQRTM